jgi:hypothetical protein
MKTPAKIFLFGCGGLLLIGVVVIGLAFAWLYTKVSDPRFTATIEQAREFGRTTDNHGCINEALRRAEKLETASPNSMEFWAESSWASNCLDTSQPTQGFCDGVPTMTEEFANALKENVYEEQMCKKTPFGQYNVHCKSVYSAKQKHCW